MAKVNIRFSDLSSISFNNDWSGYANYQRVPFAHKFLTTDPIRVQFAINSDAPLPDINIIDKCTGKPLPVILTYILEDATPSVVREQVDVGQLYVLKTPEQLGMELPVNRQFKGWSILGEIVTSITPVLDTIVEGETDLLRDNLLRGTQFLTSFGQEIGNNYPAVPIKDIYATRSYSESNAALDENFSTTLNTNDFRTLRLRMASPSRAIYGEVWFRQQVPPASITGGRRVILSFNALTGQSSGNRRVYLSNSTLASTGAPDAALSYVRKVWINGVLQVSVSPGQTWRFLLNYPDSYFVEMLFEFPNDSTKTVGTCPIQFSRSGASGSFGYILDLSLIKLEDVTNLPEEEQRASAWIPHVDDPADPIAPNPDEPPVDILSTSKELIQRYTDGQNTVYDLLMGIPREGDYEVQLSYGDAVIAKSDVSIRENLCCSKLLQYNNRENDFGTIFTPDEPFFTRIEGEFRPEDDEYGVEDSDFRDQDYGLHQMSASPTAVRKLSFGGDFGAPNFIGNKVNRIFACSEVLIDGERYIRAEGAGVTKEIWSENYPKYPWKINVEKREQGFFKAEYDIPETT